ncbi:U6 snRNA-associated Sm-like protein LSm2 [Pancytospora epiphaga]|nr:U6 snRNA-associated Sm-like protein LSm2 [Pancytospora epiphaga]
MLFYEYFKTLISSPVSVSLKNGMAMRGILRNVDPFLNITLNEITVEIGDGFLSDMETCSIRGSAIKLIRVESNPEMTKKLADATRLRYSLGHN